jgi:hypothetical protein
MKKADKTKDIDLILNIAKENGLELKTDQIDIIISKYNKLANMALVTSRPKLRPNKDKFFKKQVEKYLNIEEIKLLFFKAQELYTSLNQEEAKFYYFDDSSNDNIENTLSFFQHKTNLLYKQNGDIKEFFIKMIYNFKLIKKRFNAEKTPILDQFGIKVVFAKADNGKEVGFYYETVMKKVRLDGNISTKDGGGFSPYNLFKNVDQAINSHPNVIFYKIEGDPEEFLKNSCLIEKANALYK